MDYGCHVWTGNNRSSLSTFDRAFTSLWMMNYFAPYNLFLTDKTLQAFCFSITVSIESLLTPLISPVLPFTVVKAVNSALIVVKKTPSFLSYFIGEMEVPFEQLLPANRFFQNLREQTLKGMLPWSLQSSSKLVLTSIFPTYPDKLGLLTISIYFEWLFDLVQCEYYCKKTHFKYNW